MEEHTRTLVNFVIHVTLYTEHITEHKSLKLNTNITLHTVLNMYVFLFSVGVVLHAICSHTPISYYLSFALTGMEGETPQGNNT